MTRRAPATPRGLRERRRADGSLRVWWEPSAAARAAGFAVQEFGTWGEGLRGARKLNADVDRTLASGGRADRGQRGAVSVDQAIADLCRSPRFQGLKPKSQSSYRAQFRLIERAFGPVPVRDFTKAMVAEWYDAKAGTGALRQAQALVRALSVIFAHAERRGWRPENSNPCLNLGTITPRPRGRVCDWAELDALLDGARGLGLHSVALAVALSFFAGQRVTDILAARRGDFYALPLPGGTDAVLGWDVTRSKRGTAGWIMLHDELAPMVAARLAMPGADDAHLLTDEAVGRPYDQDLFSKRWGAVRAAAARACPSLADLQFRDLRRSFSAHADAGGASDKAAGDVLGNSVARSARLRLTYMPPQAVNAARAVQAVQRPQPKDRKDKAG